MVALIFDATAPAPRPRTVSLTFGTSRSQIRWSDRRSLTMQEFARLLQQAPVGAKDGPCYTPATFTGGARRMDQAAAIDIAVLDSDCGHSLDEIRDAITARGWQAIVHSTHSHLSDTTLIAAGAAEKWMAEHPGAGIRDYLATKKGYLPRVLEGAEVVDEVRDGNARNLVVRHAPCPKFRIIIPLAEPWLADEFTGQSLANAYWRSRIEALAHALGLHHDQSCVDTSRLFYLPRRRNADQEYLVLSLDGAECDIGILPDATPAPATAPPMPLLTAAAQAAPRLVQAGHTTAQDAQGRVIDLTAWAAEYARRFEIITALRARAPRILTSRRSGVKQHLLCPNEQDHVTGGSEGTGTFAVNASQLKQAGLPSIDSGFVIHCVHAGCAGHDRLSHLAALLRQGSLSAGDLTDPAFLTPDIPRIDASALIQSMATSLHDIAPPKVGNIAQHLWADLPGPLGEMHRWMLATAPKPQPALALGACLAFAASALGQRVQLAKWGTRPNIYVIGVAHSGSGKERALSACKQMARAAGLFQELIGVEEVASDAGIVSSVARSPRQVMLIDEISFMLNAINSKGASAHLTNVVGTLLKLYSSSRTTYQSKSYADTDKVKVIDQPCVSLYGCSTPAGLTGALTSRDITSGLLSRVVLFDAGDHDPRIGAFADASVPEGVIDWLTAWARVNPIQNPVAMTGGAPVIEPRTILVTDEAYAMAMEFEGEMHAAKAKARDSGLDALYVRALENATKFALIRACASTAPDMRDGVPSINESKIKVDSTIMQWAIELSRATVHAMTGAGGNIADTDFERRCNALRDLVQKAGPRGMTSREMAKRSAGRAPENVRNDMLKVLSGAGECFWVAGIKTQGRVRDAWVHRDFIAQHAPRALNDPDEREDTI